MKIALIAPTALPARRANTIQVMKMAQALAICGHTVRLASPRLSGAAPEPIRWDELARHYGLQGGEAARFPVEWLPARPRLRRYDYAWHAVRWARGWGAEILYTRLPQAAALASWLGLPTLFEVHDLPQGRMGPYLFHRFLKGGGARRLVAITHALADDLTRQFGAPAGPPFTCIAPDGVDLARYAGLPAPKAARRMLELPEGFTAGYTGHLYAGRGAELLLAMAERLPEVRFLLAGGEPPDVARVQADAERGGLQNVVLTGFIPNLDLPVYQAACDVLLMPYQRQVAASSGGDISRYLSPMKLFEYLACGRTILSSDLPVLREVLNAGNAVLLPPGEPQAWAKALQALQADPARRASLADQSRQDAGLYTWEARAVKILEGL